MTAPRPRAWGRLMMAAVATSLSSACSQAPTLTLPEVPLAANYREAGEATSWSAAQPADHLPRESWWRLFNDPTLDDLQQRLIVQSPDLAAALARYQQAQAATDQLRAAQLPTLGTSLTLQRNRQSERRPLRVLGPLSPNEYDAHTLSLNLDYELDLWGRVRHQVASGVALDQAAQADLASARLSLQAQLADTYLLLRGLDRDAELLADAQAAYTKARDLIQRRHEGGVSSGLDLARAEAQLATTRSQAHQSQAQRAVAEHAIAALIGESASRTTLPVQHSELPLPQVPAGLPSALLQRRPDIAAAQRRVAAANASVGMARSAVFPTVMLSASGGFQTSDIGHFIAAPNTFWAIGPALVMNLFDGGRRRAETARAEAVLDEAGARYRGVVIAAFEQVEDSLALLQHYGAAAEEENSAVNAAQRSLDIATARYKEGAASYLEVVTSQTATLQAQRSALDLSTRQRRASVQLIRALGGGWTASDAQAPQVSSAAVPSPALRSP